MADQNTTKNLSKNLPIIIAVTVMILVGGAGIWYFTKPDPASSINTAGTIRLPSSTVPTASDAPENQQPSLIASDKGGLTTTPNATSTNSNSTLNPAPSPATSSSTAASVKYKDGSYTADGSYVSPAGQESVGVTTTITAGKIASIAITPKATDSKSVRYQGFFKEGISGVVVGKSLDQDLDPGAVNGSSLTGSGFVQAMDAIKLLAQK